MSEHPKPLAVFALSYNSFTEIDAFQSVAPLIDLVFVSSPQEIFDCLRNPACFTAFIDREFNPDALPLIASEIKKRKFPWTLIVEKISAGDQEFFTKLSTDEILPYPISGPLLASRCRLMLNRYLENQDFPVPVELPPDTNVRELRQQKKQRDAFDSRRVVQVGKPAAATSSRFFNGPLKSLASPPASPAEILEAVRTRVQEIQKGAKWSNDFWPEQSLPQGTHQDEIAQSGYRQINEEISQLFRDCCFSLGAERITLISIRPDFIEAEPVYGEQLLAITSSEERIREHPSIPSALFPQIQVAVERKAAIVLNEPMPETISMHHRPDVWKLGGRIEEASAVIPLLSANQTIYATLLIQFGNPCDADTLGYLEQAAVFLGLPKLHYRHVDFLGRVYGGRG